MANNFAILSFLQDEITDEKEFHDALDSLALTFSNRVSEYLTGDIDSKVRSWPNSIWNYIKHVR